MRVVFAIHSMERGGAERVISLMANYWVTQGHEVTIITLASSELDAYILSAKINRVAFGQTGIARNVWQSFSSNVRRWSVLKDALRQIRPDVVVSFTTNINSLTVLASLRGRFPIIISERMDPLWINVGFLRNLLCKFLYPKATALVVQTEHARLVMQERFPSLSIKVIPNPVADFDPDEQQAHVPLRQLLRMPADTNIIAAMGRLGPEKGFDQLIEAFKQLSTTHRGWHLVIFGEGSSRDILESLARNNNIQDRVHLPGQVQSSRKYLSEAQLFVLSSRKEGFPNVLVEAMACGLPVISFDCYSGPSEIIRDRCDGLLVESGNIPALASAMAELMSNSSLRQELGRNACQVLERFSLDRIMGLWNKLVVDAIDGNITRSTGSL